MTRRSLVTSALPYANGPIHIGHLVEYVQTDVYVRFLKLTGREAAYICADDTHGTPIEVNARKKGVSPEELVTRMHAEHTRDFAAFDVGFDIFSSTNSDENRRLAELFFARLKEGGHVEKRPLEMFYCERDQRFLPDRFVKGVCPRCKSADQYGDVCEACGSTYAPSDLVDPRCAICGAPPVRRSSEHFFVRLADFREFLWEWVRGEGTLQEEIRNFVVSWINAGLKDWCVSRDGPYFGFPIPGEPDKYFYVWLDAPIGYVSATARWCADTGRSLDDWWKSPDTEIVHFIGKDIVYFHALFWPAMLKAAGFSLPRRIVVHGMLKVGGEKMSKSRGGKLLTAREFADALDPQLLRYYYAASLGPRPDDIEFSLEDLKNRINAELVNNVANLCHRTLTFAKRTFGGRLGTVGGDDVLCAQVMEKVGLARERYAALDFRRAVREVNEIADLGNRLLQERAPWSQVKTDRAAAQRTVTLAANVARILAVALKPVLPRFARGLEEQLRVPEGRWEDARFGLGEHEIGEPVVLVQRIEDEALERLSGTGSGALSSEERSTPRLGSGQAARAGALPAQDGLRLSPVSFDDFSKLDLRVGLVLAAERVPKADKLLKLSVDLGEGAPRTIAAGIAERYAPETMVGKRIIVVANLAPRTVRGIESRGMLLAAEGAAVAEIPGDAAPGTRVK